MARQETFIRLASKVSKDSDPTCEFCIGAVVTKNNHIISTGHVTRKSHPKNPKLRSGSKRTQLCAETLAIFRAIRIIKDLSKCVIYVARRTKSGDLAIAKPCIFCQELMREQGIRKAFFTNQEGEIEQMEII